MRITPSLLLFTSMIGLIIAPISAVSAQEAPPAQPSNPDVYRLSPFEVVTSKDNGYEAQDTIAGGRLSVNLLHSPTNVGIITKDFLDDIAANNLYAAMAFLTDTNVIDPPANALDYGSNYVIRGLPVGSNTRNYFTNEYTINEYNIDRVEGSRGPNSLLYGVSLAGGVINTLTKKAEFRDFGSISLRTDSHASGRAAVDLNREITKDAAIRVNAVHHDLHNAMTGYMDELSSADIAGTWRPWSGAEFRVEAEYGYQSRSSAWAPYGSYSDKLTSWDKTTTVAGPLTASPASSTGITRITTDYLVASSSLGQTAYNEKNFGMTNGLGTTAAFGAVGDGASKLPIENILPDRFFNIYPPDMRINSHFQSYQAFYDQTWDSGLALEVAGSAAYIRKTGINGNSFTQSYIDVNATLPDGRANPEFLQPYTESSIMQRDKYVGNYDADSRISLAYPLKTDWGTQSFSLAGLNSLTHFFQNQEIYTRLNNGNPQGSNNLVEFREYWNQPNKPLYFPTTDAAGDTFGWVPNRPIHQMKQLQTAQLGTVGSYFGDKLTVVGGARYDKFTTRELDGAFTNGQLDHDTLTDYERSADTYSAGASYFPIQQVGVFTNYALGFNPQAQAAEALPGYAFTPVTHSHDFTAGLRLNLWQGTVVGSFAYYRTVEAGRVQNIATSTIDSIWTAMGQAQNEPLGGAATYVDTYNYYGHGYELDLTANVSHELKFKLNASFPQTAQTDALPASRAYLAANLPTWQAYAQANPSVATTINNAILSFQNTVASTVNGRPINGTYDWLANFFGVYTFSSHVLNGLRVGGGVNAYGPRLIGNYNGLPFAYIDNNRYATATALVGYTLKLGKQVWDIQVNVDNLFNYRQPIYYNVGVIGSGVYAGTYKDNYSFVQPTTATLTTSVHF